MGSGLLQTVTEMASACSRHVTRAARKLRRQGPALSRMSTAVARPFLSRRQSSKKRIADRKSRSHDGEVKEEEEEEGVWRRSILMGEKCQPLDFSGVIYYDGDGRKLSEVPTPRTPLRSPLPSFPHPVTVGYDTKKDDI